MSIAFSNKIALLQKQVAELTARLKKLEDKPKPGRPRSTSATQSTRRD